MNPIRTLLGTAVALVLATGLLSGCGERVDPDLAARYPHEHTVPVQHPGVDDDCPDATVTVRSADPGWRQWPAGVPQIRLDAPEGEPRWYTIVNAVCSARKRVQSENPELPWTLEDALARLGDACPEPHTVEIPGWEAALCSGYREGDAFVSDLVAINDDHYLVIRASAWPERDAGEGTDPESLEQARPMLRAGEELLRTARPDF